MTDEERAKIVKAMVAVAADRVREKAYEWLRAGYSVDQVVVMVDALFTNLNEPLVQIYRTAFEPPPTAAVN